MCYHSKYVFRCISTLLVKVYSGNICFDPVECSDLVGLPPPLLLLLPVLLLNYSPSDFCYLYSFRILKLVKKCTCICDNWGAIG